ncbi:MAG TPA: hypothetical protein VMT52_17580 [Planctomycetota bacterium]|nr:hypothetical protein [Planctomycetota bacterium]
MMHSPSALVSSMLLWGCAAGPGTAPSAPADAEDAAEAPATWVEALDNAVFGSPAPRSTLSGDDGDARASDTEARGLAAVGEGRLEDAAALLAEASRAATPADAWRPRRLEADVLLALRQNDAAAAIYRDLIASGNHPPSASLHANLAAACHRSGDAAGARAAARDALRSDGVVAEAMKTLALADVLEGKRERAVLLLETALELKPAIPEALAALAQLEAEAGDAGAALARYRELRALWDTEKGRDTYRRWRDLYYPARGNTGEEIDARIARLEAAARNEKTQTRPGKDTTSRASSKGDRDAP